MPSAQAASAAAANANFAPAIVFANNDPPVNLSAQPGRYPMPTNIINIHTFLNAAENQGFTPTVVVARQTGLPAKNLKTGAAILIPHGTRLVLGRKAQLTCKITIPAL